MKTICQNHKILWVALSFFLVFNSCYRSSPPIPLANQNLKGLKAKTIDAILALPNEEIDIATAILLISKKGYEDLYRTEIDIEKYREKLDEMAKSLMKKIGPERNPEKITQMMSDYIYKELKFSSVPRDNTEAIFFNSALDRKKGCCLSLSFLYLSIAERIGLPLYGVELEYHTFVRFEDKRKRINIETTDEGKSVGEEYYVEKLNMTQGNPFFLKNLDKKEMISVFLSNLGTIYYNKGMLDKAIAEVELSISIDPNRVQAHIVFCDILREKGMLNEAIAEIKKAISADQNSASAHTSLGLAYHKKGMLDEAIAEMKKAIAIDQNSAFAHAKLAAVYYDKGLMDNFSEEYKKAISIDPQLIDTKSASGYYDRGQAYYEKEMYDEAIVELKKSISIDPKYVLAYSLLGNTYGRKGRYDKAIVELEKAISIDPSYGPTHSTLAVIYYMKKQYTLAIKHCDRAVELGDKVPDGFLEALKPYR